MQPRLLLVLALALCSGCYPAVAWLPDSSGFVYTGGKDLKQLKLFDVKTKKARALVEDVGGPAWPAVSPDGKRIAVARAIMKGDDLQMTVAVYDRAGRVLHRSGEMKWVKVGMKEGPYPFVPNAVWSPKGDRLLLYAYARTSLYDPRTKKLADVPGSFLPIGPSQVRPDGKGFLTKGDDGALFVGWDGKALPIRTTLGNLARTDRSQPLFTETMMYAPSRWDNAHATLRGSEVIRIDTGKREAAVAEAPKDRPGEKVVREQYEVGKGWTVRVRGLTWDGGPFDLEAIGPDGKVRIVADGLKGCKAFPSPNGRWLAVGLAPDQYIEAKQYPELVLLLLDEHALVAARVRAVD